MKFILSSVVFFVLCTTAPLLSASVSVKFENPEKYTDIDYHYGSKLKFRKRLFKEIKAYLDEDAAKVLPENYQLELTFTNIDLAGYIDYAGIDPIRIVRDIDFPRLKFSYQLSKDKQPIKQADVYLKDMNFLHSNIHFNQHNRDSFYHTRRLLKEWLTEEIKPLTK